MLTKSNSSIMAVFLCLLAYFVFVFCMTYGYKNSGLIYSRYGALSVFITALCVLSIGFTRLKLGAADYVYFLLVFFVFLSSISSMNIDIALSAINYLVFTLSSYFLINQLFRKYGVDFIRWFGLANIAISCLAVLIGLYVINVTGLEIGGVKIDYDITFSKRMNSWFNNSTVLGIYIAFSFCFLMYFYKKGYIGLIVYLSISLLLWVGLIQSGGRTGVFVLFLAYLMIFIRFKITFKIVFYIILLILGLLVLLYNFEFYIHLPNSYLSV